MKKIFTLIILSVFCLNAIHAETTWTLSDDGTLTISGTTDMPDYFLESDVPWNDKRNVIKKVVIEDGVSWIGNFAFSG